MNNFKKALLILQETNKQNTSEYIITAIAKYNKKVNFFLYDMTPIKLIEYWYKGVPFPKGLKIPVPKLSKDILDKIFIMYDYVKDNYNSVSANFVSAVINLLIFEYWFGDYEHVNTTDIIKQWNPEVDPLTPEFISNEWRNIDSWLYNNVIGVQTQTWYRNMYVEHVRDEYLLELKQKDK